MKRLTILLILTIYVNCLHAQQIIYAKPGDELSLRGDDYEGDIQWQQADDSETWVDIEGGDLEPLVILVEGSKTYYRAVITNDKCETHFTDPILVEDIDQSPATYWSETVTWGNAGKPKAGEVVTIPVGQRVILDENPPALGGLIIEGKLEFARMNLFVSSDYIVVPGIMEIGTEEQPFEEKAVITLTGDKEQSIMDMGSRGIIVSGILELHGAVPDVLWTQLGDHGVKGATSLTLKEEVSWKVDDEIVVSPTDYFLAGSGSSVSQKIKLTGLGGTQISLTEGLNAHRWGKLQYATNSGMSLTPASLVIPPVADTDSTSTPVVLDERAEIGNLTRNIIIQSLDDDLWKNQGFGANTMIMGPGGIAHVEGVEFKRGGQRGELGRYPFHWHMMSYSGSKTIDDAKGQYLKNCSINQSKNRGVVIHGTNGVLVQNNVIFDVQGHGVFTEDAVERRNKIEHNLVLKVRNPPYGKELKQHEIGEFGSSGFWISNPDNDVADNVAADCGTFGFWLAFPAQPWGLNQGVLAEDGLLINPSRIQFGSFENNTAHSNQLHGIMLDNVEVQADGTTGGHQYWSTTNGRDGQWPFPNLRRFSLAKYKVWKNGANGIWDRAVWPTNYEVVSADNCGRFFAGSGSDGVIERSLVVGTSLNHMMNGTDRPAEADYQGGFNSSNPAAFATYHSTFDIKDNVVINFPAEAGKRSGVFATDDYYIRAVDKGQYRNSNNLIIQSHPGVKLQAPWTYMTLASALWDPHGIWGPEENYLVYDTPFLTHGKGTTEIYSKEITGGVSVPGPYYGFSGFVLYGVGDDLPQNQPYMDLWGIQVRRLDNNLNEVATWIVPQAQQDWVLQHMRDFATTPEGIYELTFPEETVLPTDFSMEVDNMLTTDDKQLMAIQFDGTLNPIVVMTAYQYYEVYEKVNSLELVRSSEGATWWQDKTNNFIWLKMRGGIWQFWTTDETQDVPTSDDLLYETTQLRIYESS